MRTIALAMVAGIAATASAQVVGYFTDGNAGTTDPEAGIIANGFTPVQILDITTFDFNTIDSLVINNGSNSGYSAELLGRVADIDAWTFAGGNVMTHDRFVSDGTLQHNPMLIGSPGTLSMRDFTNDADIDILTSKLIDNGPHGVLDNTSLDGGNSSSHGFIDASTLPGGATVALIRGGWPNEGVTVSYTYGGGFVVYSTIPLDFYLGGGTNFDSPYYPNAVAYMKTIPAPASLALLGLGGLVATRRRR